MIARDYWIEPAERAAIVAFARQYPLEGYRRLTFMMLDRDVAAVNPATTYRGAQRRRADRFSASGALTQRSGLRAATPAP
jgi:hypothetical protein